MRALHQWFEQQAAARPDAVAVVFGNSRLSYAELNIHANRLARSLRDRGVGPDTPVGLCFTNEPRMIIGLLAILKAGGGYVPLDPELPADRLSHILAQAKPALVVTETSLLGALPSEAVRKLCIDDERELIEAQSSGNPGWEIDSGHLCYVMFTSGSSGMPKGVMVTHGNLEHLFDDIGAQLAFECTDVWTLFHTFAFGFSVWEIWGALRHGGRLVIVPPETRTNPERLRALVHDQHVTIISQTPSAFRQNLLADAFEADFDTLALRAVVLSGEAVVQQDLRRWFKLHGDAGPRILNTYAITETGGQVTFREYVNDEFGRDSGNGVTRLVGRPLGHVELLILDSDGQPVATGSAGELFVS